VRRRRGGGGEGPEEEGNSSRRGSVRGAAGCSRGGADPRVRSLEEVKRIKQQLRRAEADKQRAEAKLAAKRQTIRSEKEKITAAEKRIEKLKKEGVRMRKANEKLGREKEEAIREAKEESGKWRKKCENLKVKMSNIELEKVKLESKVSSLSISAEPEAGPSSAGASGGGPGLFQDMLDNFRELAETQLQCAVCSELFVEAVSVNCGHTFCHYCITQWKKKKANCPVCRADIKQMASCKVLDEYTDKLYDQFVPEGGKQQRKLLKEEREKIKKDEENAAQARLQARRERAQARRAGGLEMVNIVVNRARRDAHGSDESSLDSDATLELHLSDGLGDLSDGPLSDDLRLHSPPLLSDSDSSSSLPRVSLSRLFEDPANSDTDSSDEDFRSSPVFRSSSPAGAADTDSVSDSTDSPSSPSSDSSSDSDSDF